MVSVSITDVNRYALNLRAKKRTAARVEAFHASFGYTSRRGQHSLPETDVTETKTKIKQIIIHIDQQKFELESRTYTPRELLLLADENPDETTLVLKKGLKKFEDPNEPIEMENGMHFVVFHNGPTPVS